jgi:hypothetical protein
LTGGIICIICPSPQDYHSFPTGVPVSSHACALEWSIAFVRQRALGKGVVLPGYESVVLVPPTAGDDVQISVAIQVTQGYRDLVAITTAMEDTVKWLVANPPTVDWLSASYPEHDGAIRKALQIASS